MYQIAQETGLLVPKFKLINFMNKAPTFIVQNFMEKRQVGNLVHIYHFLNSEDEFDCETLLSIVENKTQRAVDIKQLIETTLFDALIGNHDRHGRNLGLIRTAQGYKIAPMYDNPSYLGIEEEWLLAAQHEPRGAIATAATKEPSMIDYVVEWYRLGYQKEVKSFSRKINLNRIATILSQSPISNQRKEALKKLIDRRHSDLIEGIKNE